MFKDVQIKKKVTIASAVSSGAGLVRAVDRLGLAGGGGEGRAFRPRGGGKGRAVGNRQRPAWPLLRTGGRQDWADSSSAEARQRWGRLTELAATMRLRAIVASLALQCDEGASPGRGARALSESHMAAFDSEAQWVGGATALSSMACVDVVELQAKFLGRADALDVTVRAAGGPRLECDEITPPATKWSGFLNGRLALFAPDDHLTWRRVAKLFFAHLLQLFDQRGAGRPVRSFSIAAYVSDNAFCACSSAAPAVRQAGSMEEAHAITAVSRLVEDPLLQLVNTCLVLMLLTRRGTPRLLLRWLLLGSKTPPSSPEEGDSRCYSAEPDDGTASVAASAEKGGEVEARAARSRRRRRVAKGKCEGVAREAARLDEERARRGIEAAGKGTLAAEESCPEAEACKAGGACQEESEGVPTSCALMESANDEEACDMVAKRDQTGEAGQAAQTEELAACIEAASNDAEKVGRSARLSDLPGLGVVWVIERSFVKAWVVEATVDASLPVRRARSQSLP